MWSKQGGESSALTVWKEEGEEEEGYSSKKWKIDESSHLKWVYNNHTKWQGAWQVKDYAIVLCGLLAWAAAACIVG